MIVYNIWKSNTMEIALIIPVYNEETTIKKVITEVSQYIKSIIVINDCSTDNSKQILTTLPVTLINNNENLGYAKSLEKGMKIVFQQNIDYVITFDADGQHEAKDLTQFISVIEKYKPDFIFGKRLVRNRFMEYIWSYYAKKKYGFSDPLCGFKAIKKEVFLQYEYLEKHYTIGLEMIFSQLKKGTNFKEVTISINKRKDKPRFGNAISGNWLELKALLTILTLNELNVSK